MNIQPVGLFKINTKSFMKKEQKHFLDFNNKADTVCFSGAHQSAHKKQNVNGLIESLDTSCLDKETREVLDRINLKIENTVSLFGEIDESALKLKKEAMLHSDKALSDDRTVVDFSGKVKKTFNFDKEGRLKSVVVDKINQDLDQNEEETYFFDTRNGEISEYIKTIKDINTEKIVSTSKYKKSEDLSKDSYFYSVDGEAVKSELIFSRLKEGETFANVEYSYYNSDDKRQSIAFNIAGNHALISKVGYNSSRKYYPLIPLKNN